MVNIRTALLTLKTTFCPRLGVTVRIRTSYCHTALHWPLAAFTARYEPNCCTIIYVNLQLTGHDGITETDYGNSGVIMVQFAPTNCPINTVDHIKISAGLCIKQTWNLVQNMQQGFRGKWNTSDVCSVATCSDSNWTGKCLTFSNRASSI